MLRIAIAIAFAALAAGSSAGAQDWPTRPIMMVVPFAAGGPIDTLARILTPGLSEQLGQSVVVENVGGAGGMNGAARVARAEPDGYTFGFGNQGTHVFSRYLYKKPLYNPDTDFTPIGLVVGNSKVLVVRKDLPVNNMKEFVAYARKNESKMQYGSGGGGSATHIACVLLTSKIGAPKITHVPYRGVALAIQDITAGRIDFLCDITSTAQPQIVGGRVKAIATLRKTRSPALPNVPTALEQGFADVDADGWNAFIAPRGTPPAIVAKINAATGKLLDDPVISKRLLSLGLEVPPKQERSPEYLTQLVKDEVAKWGPPITAAIGAK
ncbi:MAG: tripartite tricarboxylate transporter substrate binding protein BugD [Rhizobiales bacterium]|nr:tripartite tricarboxylate transporter substrate binding protein BugD [Hyphomicrobiales bacterium]